MPTSSTQRDALLRIVTITAARWGHLSSCRLGQTVVLVTDALDAVFGWWRPDPSTGITAMNGLDGWTCTIFHNESRHLSSAMILDAERWPAALGYDCGPDGLLTYVWDSRIRSVNPGYCFKCAGYTVRGRSADNKKTLLWKPQPAEWDEWATESWRAQPSLFEAGSAAL